MVDVITHFDPALGELAAKIQADPGAFFTGVAILAAATWLSWKLFFRW